MTPAELIAAGQLLHGRRWKLPLARTVGYGREALHCYSIGRRRVPPLLAARIRAIVNIGPVGTAIRNTIKKSMPEIPPFTAHRMAKQILFDLISLGMVAENSLNDDEETGLSRRKGSGIE